MNKDLIQKRFAKNLDTYNDNAKIQKKMAERLLSFLNRKDFNDILDSMINTQGYEPDEALEVLKGSMDEKDFKKFQKSNKVTSAVKNTVTSAKTKIANSKAGKGIGNLKNSIDKLKNWIDSLVKSSIA